MSVCRPERKKEAQYMMTLKEKTRFSVVVVSNLAIVRQDGEGAAQNASIETINKVAAIVSGLTLVRMYPHSDYVFLDTRNDQYVIAIVDRSRQPEVEGILLTM